jgi:integrase
MAPAAPPESPVKRAAFSGFAKRWLDTYIKTNRKHSYYRSTEQILRCHLVPFFGNQDLRSIDQEQVALYKAAKIDGTASVVGKRTKTVLMAKTVNNHIGVISILFEKAVDWGYCERNPVTGVGLLRLPPQEFKFWDREQSDAFLGALLETEPEYFPLFLCALRTGMRQGELFALRWDDLDFVKRQLRVVWNWTHGKLDSPKGGRGRSIPMSAELGHVLHEHRHLRGPLVFCREGGGYLSGDVVKHPFNRATRKAGVERIRFHDMRHSFASQLVMAGVPLKAVQEYLGHADLSMTMRYAHLSPTAKQDFIACLDSGVPERMCGAAWSQIGPNSGPAMMAGRKRALEN